MTTIYGDNRLCNPFGNGDDIRKQDAMTTTDTATTATNEETQYIKAQDWPQCSICGVMFSYADHGPYAHNTCSQRCACTAAIVEAINGWRLDSFPPNDVCNMQSHWAGPLTADDCTQHE